MEYTAPSARCQTCVKRVAGELSWVVTGNDRVVAPEEGLAPISAVLPMILRHFATRFALIKPALPLPPLTLLLLHTDSFTDTSRRVVQPQPHRSGLGQSQCSVGILLNSYSSPRTLGRVLFPLRRIFCHPQLDAGSSLPATRFLAPPSPGLRQFPLRIRSS